MEKKRLHELLPPGFWFVLKDLNRDTTAHELVEHFRQHGMRVPPENIVVSPLDHYDSATAFVSVPRESLARLITWALNDDPLRGKTPMVNDFRKRLPMRSEFGEKLHNATLPESLANS